MKKDKILVIGACGQLGTELTAALRKQYGFENVIAADKKPATADCISLDVLDTEKLRELVNTCAVTQVYLLAAMLSARGEQYTAAAWNLNIKSLISVLDIAKEEKLDKVFWPSSIAVFGPGSPKHHCPQDAIMVPGTVYGIGKLAGENWCKYYFEKFGVDVRSIRYPGLISYSTLPGGGTTDYAIDIFHHALEGKSYTCFLNEDTCLPMMYMNDAVRATLALMNAPKESVKIRTSYNISGTSFAPCDIAAAIRKHIPEFKISYEPDFREAIAKAWPASISDCCALRDWGWKPRYKLPDLTGEMLQKLAELKGIPFKLKAGDDDFYPDFPMDNYVFTKHYE